MKLLSHVRLLATSWTVAYQAPAFMGFSRQEYWSGAPLPSPSTLLRTLNCYLTFNSIIILLLCILLGFSDFFILYHSIPPYASPFLLFHLDPQKRKNCLININNIKYLFSILVSWHVFRFRREEEMGRGRQLLVILDFTGVTEDALNTW